ncbi:MAG: TolC family protein [Bacteroides sp.]|nr:TolC family protein [Bacteroides sp.]MCM1379626.1 TolC family protein [Bacteroides sp.]MCM1445992.1 TolC family protein [Prevotella sp.]
MRKSVILCWLSIISLGVAAQGFEPIVAEVVGNNPTMAAEIAAGRAETLQRVAENRLAPTEVGFTYEWPSKSVYDLKRELTVEQSFDWPGAYGARRAAARIAEVARQERLRATERSLKKETRELLCRIVDANLRCDMLRTIVSNLDSLHGSMHQMLERRQITELDHRKVALEEVSMKQQLSDAESARAETLAQLAALNGGTLPAESAELRSYPEQTLQPLENYLRIESPEVAAMRQESSAIQLDAKAEKMALYPGFSLGYVFEHEGPSYHHGFSIGLTLPSYSAKPKTEAARWQARALELQAEQVESDRRAAISAAHASAVHIEKLLKDYDYAFGKEYPQLLKKALVGGQLSYIEYFSELNFYLTARLDYLSQLLNYHTLLCGIDLK